MSVTTALASGGPIRRRRLIIFLTILVGFLFFYGVPWSLPASLKDAGYEALSRANVAQLMKSNTSPPVKVDELFGLLHLVTSGGDLSTAANLDPSQPIDMTVYADGDARFDWGKEVRKINTNYPLIVFSKSYCPQVLHLSSHGREIDDSWNRYSRRAKKLLEAYDIQPAPKIIEVDLRGSISTSKFVQLLTDTPNPFCTADDSNIIKSILTRLTHHSTFPNIVIRGKSIGGSDDLQALHVQRELIKVLVEAGAEARDDGSSQDIPS